MKHARGQRRIDLRLAEYAGEVLDGPGAAGGNEGDSADLANTRQLLDVVAASHPVASHAIENDLARAAILDFLHPLQHVAPGLAGPMRIAGELISSIAGGAMAVIREPAVDADDDALCAEASAEGIDEAGVGERRGVDGYLLGAGVENFLSVRDRADAACDTERNVENSRHP